MRARQAQTAQVARVFQFSGSIVDEGESLAWLGGMTAKGGGLVCLPGGGQQVYRRVAKGAQHLRGRSRANPAAVLAEGHVTGAEEIVLDPPVRPAQLQQRTGVGRLPPKAGDAVDDLPCGLAVDTAQALQFERLLQTRPVDVAIQDRSGGDSPTFDAAVSFVMADRLPALALGQTALPRGKGICSTKPWRSAL